MIQIDTIRFMIFKFYFLHLIESFMIIYYTLHYGILIRQSQITCSITDTCHGSEEPGIESQRY